MLLKRSFVLAAAMLALSACAGGGGGGGGATGPATPVTPLAPKPPAPPATPYASNCATTPNALTCSGGALGTGAFTLQEMQFDTDKSAFDYIAFDNRKTTRTDDDQYVVVSNTGGVAPIYRYYDTPTPKNDGLGPIRVGANYGRDGITGAHLPGNGSTLTLYDITNVLQGGLDYVQLGSLSSAGATGAPSYFAVSSGGLKPLLPTTGSAKFDGGTRGAYVTGAGAVYNTASDITLTADFAKASVTGSASNFYVTDSTGAAAFAPRDLNFSVSGTIATSPVFGPRFAGTATGTNLSGTVNGAFIGELGKAPAEIGLSYKLTDPGGGTLVGVGGLKRNP